MATDYLHYQGVTYSLGGYMTQAQYCAKWGIAKNTLNNRIRRGNLPAGMVLRIPEWSLILVRDQAFDLLPPGPKASD